MKETFLNRFKELMESKNMTQSELSKKTGITQSSISDWLRGKYLPKQDKIDLLARALDVTPAYLMGWNDDSNPHKIIGTEFESPYLQSKDLMDVYLRGVLHWITDKNQNPKDTILLTRNFYELLFEYKLLVERYLQLSNFWESSSETIKKEYTEKFPDIDVDKIIIQYFRNELSSNIDSVCNKVKSLPVWRKIYYDYNNW